MERAALDRIRTERLERIEENLVYLLKVSETKKQVELLERDARMMKDGVNDLYYALLDEIESENRYGR